MRIVITGGMGSGKSTVVSHLRTLLDDYEFFDADAFVRTLYNDVQYQALLIEAFGTCERELISSIVFEHPDKKKKLYAIMNQQIFDQADREALKENIVFDMPLYFECKQYLNFIPDLVVCVACLPETQRQRIKLRNGFSDSKIDSIIAQQLSVDEKKRLSDYVIDSNWSLQSTKDATTMLVANLGI